LLKALRVVVRMLSRLSQLPDGLNWLLSVFEPLIVLVIGFLILYSAYWLVFGSEQSARQTRIMLLIRGINDNWKAALILLVPLFYRTVRVFLEQAEEAFSVKRPLRGGPVETGESPTREKH
jgi:hypothetical protein